MGPGRALTVLISVNALLLAHAQPKLVFTTSRNTSCSFYDNGWVTRACFQADFTLTNWEGVWPQPLTATIPSTAASLGKVPSFISLENPVTFNLKLKSNDDFDRRCKSSPAEPTCAASGCSLAGAWPNIRKGSIVCVL